MVYINTHFSILERFNRHMKVSDSNRRTENASSNGNTKIVGTLHLVNRKYSFLGRFVAFLKNLKFNKHRRNCNEFKSIHFSGPLCQILIQ